MISKGTGNGHGRTNGCDLLPLSRVLPSKFTKDIIHPARQDSGLRDAYLRLKSLKPLYPDGKGFLFSWDGFPCARSMIRNDSVFLRCSTRILTQGRSLMPCHIGHSAIK